jgi:hypothetical protein
MKKAVLFSALMLSSALALTTAAQAEPRIHSNHVAAFHHFAGHPHVRFHVSHDFRHFTPAEHRYWAGGAWRHTWWHGHYGWWWNVGPSWYFYTAPVYPYPGYVSDTYYDNENYDDSDQGGDDQSGYDQGPGDQGGYDQGPGDQNMGPGDNGGGPGVWFHCAKPDGYYPYVKSCRGGWEQVPATPNDAGPQGGMNDGPPPGYNGGDQGPPSGR